MRPTYERPSRGYLDDYGESSEEEESEDDESESGAHGASYNAMSYMAPPPHESASSAYNDYYNDLYSTYDGISLY